MNTIYFISEDYLKQNSPINLNVEQTLLNNAIIDAQILRIQSVLGSALYKKIETLISAGDITLPANSNYKTLLDDYIQPAVRAWALVEALPYIRYKIVNKSITAQNSDNSTPIDLEEMKYFTANLTNKAEFYCERIAYYLCDNSNLFPEYRSTVDNDILPDKTGYFCGIQLDDDNYCERRIGYNYNTYDL